MSRRFAAGFANHGPDLRHAFGREGVHATGLGSQSFRPPAYFPVRRGSKVLVDAPRRQARMAAVRETPPRAAVAKRKATEGNWDAANVCQALTCLTA
jgi:hypothetical protein